MGSIFRFVDPDDTSKVRLDLMTLAESGATTGMKVLARDFNLGEIEDESEFLENPHEDSGELVATRHPNSEMTLRVRIKGSTTDQWVEFARALAKELDREHNMIEVKLNGSSTSAFIKTFVSPKPQLLQDLGYATVSRKDVPTGIPVRIIRHPHAHLEELEASVNKLKNATLLIDSSADGTPDNWTKGANVTGTPSLDFSDEAVETVMSAAGFVFDQEFVTTVVGQAWTGFATLRKMSGAGNVRVRVDWHNGTSWQLGPESSSASTSKTVVSSTVTTGAGVTKVRLVILSTGAGTFRMGLAQLNEGATAKSFRVGADTVKNNGRGMFVYNPGNMTAEAQVIMEPETGSKITDVYVAAKANHNIVEFANKSYFDLVTSATAGIDTSSVTDGDWTGNVLETNFANTPHWRRRWRLVINPVDNTYTLRGRCRVHVAMRAASPDEVNNPPDAILGMQLRYKLRDDSGATPAEEANAPVRYDSEELTSFKYTEVNLGVIDLGDDGVDKLVLEGWGRRREDTGNGRIRWAAVCLVPLESFTRLAVPGIDDGASHPTVWRGNELKQVTDGVGGDGFPVMNKNSRVKDYCILGGQGDIVGTTGEVESTAGEGNYIPLEVGRHHFKVLCSIENDDETRIRAARFKIRKRTGAGTFDTIDSIPLFTRDDHWATRKQKRITFDVTSAGDYRAIVELDHNGTVAPSIAVLYIRHTFERFATVTEQLVFNSHSHRRVLRNLTDKQVIAKLHKRGPWLKLRPGLTYLQFGIGEELGPGYDDIIDGRSLTRHRPGRGMTVKVDMFPRAFPL